MVNVKKSLINFFSRNLKCELGEVKFTTRNTPNNIHIKEFYYYTLYNNQITILNNDKTEYRGQTERQEYLIVFTSLPIYALYHTPDKLYVNHVLRRWRYQPHEQRLNINLVSNSTLCCFVYVSVMYIFTYYQFHYAAADVSNSAMKQHNNVAVNIFRKYQP